MPLDYEHEVRKEAMRRMEEGTPLAKAMVQALQDMETKMTYFTDLGQFRKRAKKICKQSFFTILKANCGFLFQHCALPEI